MEPRLLLRVGIGASVIGHLALMAGLILTEARPFEPSKQDTIAVDLVTPDEAPKPVPPKLMPEPAKEAPSPAEKPPAPDLTGVLDQAKPSLQTSTPPPSAAKPSAASEVHEPVPKTETKPEPRSATKSAPPPRPPPAQQASVQPQAEPPPAPASMPSPPPPSAAPIMAPEPDVTVKYGVMLGLPEATSADPLGGAGVATAAKIDISATAKFRQHLRTCSALPAQVAAVDKVRIVLRVLMSRDGTLAAPPGLIEASASPAKGLALMQAATKALESCQPYAMLPADKYDEWKVLDLTFTPQDFVPG